MNKDLQFSGMWAIILGGSSGFGLAAVEKLTQHGMNVAVLYREISMTEKLLKQRFSQIASDNLVQILSFNINALEQSGRETFIQNFLEVVGTGNVKLLLHSIARGNLKPLIFQDENAIENDLLSIEDIEFTTYAMSNSLLDWTRSLFKNNLFHSDARIIGLTSEGAHKYWEGYAAVSIAKASLESLSKYMAIEFAKFGIKTNLIQAGITNTLSMKKIPESEKLIELANQRNPMGRITQPEDVANVIYLLCKDEAFWINGSVIHVDGGEHCQ